MPYADNARCRRTHTWRSYDEKDPTRREEIAHRVAWAAVKRRDRKSGRRRIPVDH